MSFRWPNKDPDEILDYSVDWSRWLNGSEIVNCKWYVNDANGVKTELASGQVVNNIQNVFQTNTADTSTINLGLGSNNHEYKFYCRITTTTGSIGERIIRLRIKEQ